MNATASGYPCYRGSHPHRVNHLHQLTLLVGVSLDIFQLILDHHPRHLHLYSRAVGNGQPCIRAVGNGQQCIRAAGNGHHQEHSPGGGGRNGHLPLGLWAHAGRRPRRACTPTGRRRRCAFGKQITNNKVFRKQITDDIVGYRTK